MEEASRLGNFHNFTYKNEREKKRKINYRYSLC